MITLPLPRRASAQFVRLSHAVLIASALVMLIAREATAQTRRANSSPTRIAVFDSRVVFDSMPERAAAESEFALEQAKMRTLLGHATDSLQAVIAEFTRAEQGLSPRQREAATMQLRARELLVEEMVATLDDVIMRRHAEIQAPMRQRVRAAVREVRLREGYDLVLDLANEDVITEADARIDITSAVLRALRAPASRPSPPRP
jgi:Skp family chaperone for outer membrane proteins